MKRRFDVRRLWLCLPTVPLAILDWALTLTGQSDEYWAGDYDQALEANPLARLFLVWSPHAFQALLVGLILSYTAAFLLFSKSLAIVVSFFITFAHAVGSSTWLWRMGPGGVILSVGVFLVSERLIDLSWRRLEQS